MDCSLHGMFDNGAIQFLPFTHTELHELISGKDADPNTDSPSYLIQIDFRTGYIATT